MPTWAVILIVLAAVAAAAMIATMTMRQRRTEALRNRFGPEYDRTMQGSEDRRAAELQLRAREQQRAGLDIRPLPEASRIRYGEEWLVVQERFVDEPAEAVGSADSLLHQVMAERGYPMGDFAAQSDLISVDHPEVVENYRVAQAIRERTAAGQVGTEELRDALLRYRSLFDDMLRAGQDGVAADDTTIRPGGDAIVDRDTADRGTADRGAITDSDIPGDPDIQRTTVPAQQTAGQTTTAPEADDDAR
jgi:hypothetical protein